MSKPVVRFGVETRDLFRAFLHSARNSIQQSQTALSLLKLEAAEHAGVLELVGEVEAAGDALTQLFETMRAFLEPVLLEPQRIDLRQSISTAWRGVAAGHADATLDLGNASPCNAWVDPPVLEAAFGELMQNALQARPDGLRVRVRTRTQASNEGRALILSLTDNGPGLSPYALEHAFEPFWSGRSGGRGMGLPVARKLIEAHGGSLALHLAEGGGTEAEVVLPESPGADAGQSPSGAPGR